MRDIWYSDDRDLVKWGVLTHIAQTNSLQTIVQVPYWRQEIGTPHFTFRQETFNVGPDVWSFFRDIQHSEQLIGQDGLQIKVIMDVFNHLDRATYSDTLSRHLAVCRRPLLLFLDPDTGLEPQRSEVTHTTKVEVQRAWKDLQIGDWLVFYQHARRHKTAWVESVSEQLSEACGGATVEVARSEKVGRDVAFLCVNKRG